MLHIATTDLTISLVFTPTEEYSEDSLDAEAKVRYEKKLQLSGLATCPYKLSLEAWIDDVTLWPPVEFPDIVLYLLQTPGKYTREKLKAYKSLEAYNYFLSDWVGTCYYHKITDSEFCVIKAAVRPSQRLSEKPHRPWVGLRQKDGSISVACTLHMHGWVSVLQTLNV